jgi:hypothetical protein
MDKTVFSMPSFYGHVVNGIFLFAAFVLVILWGNRLKLDTHNTIILLLLISIAVGIHTLGHIGLETVYKYNPLEPI